MKHLVLTIITFLAFFSSCSQKKEKETKLQKIDTALVLKGSLSNCSRIYTAEWNIHKIVYFSDTVSTFLGIKFNSFGDRKLIVPIDAKVKSYVDMGQISEKDIHIDSEGVITMILPKPKVEITSTKIDWDAAKSYVSFYRSSFSEREKSDLLYQGEKSIRDEVSRLDLDAMAKHTAARAISPLVKQLGFSDHKINIIFSDKISDGK